VRLNATVARTHTAVLFVSLIFAFPVAAQPRSLAAASPAAEVYGSRVRIDNFGQVNARYYRGEQPEGRDYEDLAALGIRTVIDLQADGENSDEERLVSVMGMKFYRIPMTTHVPPASEQLALFLQIVNDPAQQPIYVHCAGGRHRTGVMTAVYRMTQDGWTADQAFKEMKRYKFGADFLHLEFKRFVYGYRVDMTVNAPALVAAPTKPQS
jgi:tyrosine-protein phosphatase SIW14